MWICALVITNCYKSGELHTLKKILLHGNFRYVLPFFSFTHYIYSYKNVAQFKISVE